jgi:hypothetical protein
MSARQTKLHCWEFKRCGRQPGGPNVPDLGLCPATAEERLDGVHDGTNAGRACWIVSGKLCKGEVQGTFAQKFKNCELCDFYQKVKTDEHPRFSLSAELISKVR